MTKCKKCGKTFTGKDIANHKAYEEREALNDNH